MRNSVDVFRRTYEKFGLMDASKIMGLETYELINYGKLSFDIEDAEILLQDMMSNGLLPKTYKGYKLYYDNFSGTLYWGKDINELTIIEVMATPFWGGTKEIPIDIQIIYYTNKDKSESYEDDFSDVIELDNMEFKDIEDLLVWFRDFYLPETYNRIKSIIKD